MRRIMSVTLLLVLLVVVGAVAAQGPDGESGGPSIGDSYYSDLGNGGYDVQHYTLDIAYDVEARFLQGTATIEAVAMQDLSDFNLDFSGLHIGTVTVNDAPADSSREAAELTITPAETLPQGEPFTVVVSYEGLPQAVQPSAIPVTMGWNAERDLAYVASEPVGASTWYPVNEHPLDKATYTLRVTVPEGYEVAANGLLTDTVANDDATQTYTFEHDFPAASYLISVNIGDYVLEELEGPDGLPIRNYYPPELAEDASYDFAQAADMIAFFSDTFGPYPFETYGVVVVDQPLGFALEVQTLSLFGARHVDGERSVEETAAHELAHQWFGDSVSLADWSDIWLNEGFATYSQMLWLEHAYGSQRLDREMRNFYGFVEQSGERMPAPGMPAPDDLFNPSVYVRGALTLHALRLQVGDEAFFTILRDYYAAYQYGNATTAGFIAIAEEVSGEDLGDFFDGWLYTQAVPAIPEMGLGD